MKRFVMLLVVIALPLLAGSMTRTVSYDLNDVMLSKVSGYDVVDLPGVLPLVKPGEPRLPDVIQTVAIPAGADPTSVELIAEEWVDLPGNYRVGPSQADVRLPLRGRDVQPRDLPAQPGSLCFDRTLSGDESPAVEQWDHERLPAGQCRAFPGALYAGHRQTATGQAPGLSPELHREPV